MPGFLCVCGHPIFQGGQSCQGVAYLKLIAHIYLVMHLLAIIANYTRAMSKHGHILHPHTRAKSLLTHRATTK